MIVHAGVVICRVNNISKGVYVILGSIAKGLATQANHYVCRKKWEKQHNAANDRWDKLCEGAWLFLPNFPNMRENPLIQSYQK